MKTLRILFFTLLIAGITSTSMAAGTINGKFTANGQDAKLAYAIAVKGKSFAGKPTAVIILSEKDPSQSKKPDFDVTFGRLGNALAITIDEQGQILSTQIYHNALKMKQFSSSGRVELENFKNDKSSASGKLTTGGEQTTFDEKWLIDLTFNAKKK